MKCIVCNKEISSDDIVNVRDEYEYLFDQANLLGMDSLTEQEQTIVEYRAHVECII